MQVFHAVWLVDEDGAHPEPYALVSPEDVAEGRWRFNPAVAAALGLDEDYLRRYLIHYVQRLARGGKYALTIWPYHAMLGGIGHALVPAIEEAIFFHGIARRSQPDFRVKGNNPLTEHYSALGPEVGGQRNEDLVELLRGYDLVLIAGQAKSHCVAWTVEDLLEDMSAERIYLLEDCTSPVVVPGAVDYTADANAAVERFAAAGINVVRSTEPMETWPGVLSRLS
jgi:nicotinamidase-related amidase